MTAVGASASSGNMVRPPFASCQGAQAQPDVLTINSAARILSAITGCVIDYHYLYHRFFDRVRKPARPNGDTIPIICRRRGRGLTKCIRATDLLPLAHHLGFRITEADIAAALEAHS